MATRLFCDSDCELWYTDIEKLNIDLIKMPYILDGEEYFYDLGKDTDFAHFYKRLKEGATPTTSALNEMNYLEIFEPVFAAGDDIFYVAFSAKLSATFEFMNTALTKLKAKYPERKFYHFDTKGISLDTGIQVYYAAKLKNEGASNDEIMKFLEEFSPRVKTYFSVDDLNHLQRGGRISKVAAVFGTALGLKPIITITEEGTLQPIDKIKGNKKVISYLVNKFKEEACDLDKYDIWILQADCEERAAELKERLLEVHPDARINTIVVGPVIGAHCGPGTLGLIYVSK